MPKGKPLAGDRAAWDADGYPLLHANDTDTAADALHHTLGTGATQAAAGDHTHAQLHDAATVAASSTVNLSITGQQISADVIPSGIDAADLASGVATDGQVLTADGTGGAAWEAPGGGALASLSDVDVAGVINGQRLTYNSTSGKWEPVSPSAGDGDVVGPASATDGHLAVFDGATGKIIKDGGAPGSGGGMAYILLKHTATSGTHGGGISSGDWRTRPINTEEVDTGSNASISSNQITLAAGTYRCRIMSSVGYVGAHKARLRNITDGSTELEGTSETNTTGTILVTQTPSWIVGRFTLAASKTLEIQHRVDVTRDTEGFGRATGYGETEVYCIAEFWKE